MVLPDHEIAKRALAGMMDHFQVGRVKPQRGQLSWGLSSYGYDLRLSRRFKVFRPSGKSPLVIDPKQFDPSIFEDVTGSHCIIPPNSFALGESVETLDIPRDVLAIVLGKSTYARCGIVTAMTPLEPEWRGTVTIEISNTTPLPAKVYAGEGIVQVVFLVGTSPCETSYADKRGRYQDQQSITAPRV